MQTSFTSGIFTARYNECGSPHWQVADYGGISIGIIDEPGDFFIFNSLTYSFLAERLNQLAQLQRMISQQYSSLHKINYNEH